MAPETTMDTKAAAIATVLAQANGQPGQITKSQNTTKNGQSNSTAGRSACPRCGGTGWFVPDLPVAHKEFGRAVRCGECSTDYSRWSGLTDVELGYTADSILGNGDTPTALRYLVEQITHNPTGWLTLWGVYGTAKTLTIQAIVANLIRQKKLARFYHAKQLEQGWFDDMHADRLNAKVYLDAPVLAIDELDKVNLNNDWVRQQFQALLDHRYRQGIAGKQLTLITLQYEPEKAVPGDIASRMGDGRFYRVWTGGPNRLVIDRWGEQVLPGCLHIEGKDARPQMAPDEIKQKQSAGVHAANGRHQHSEMAAKPSRRA